MATIFHIAFNQDHSRFSLATDRGFKIYNTDPYQCIANHTISHGGIRYLEMFLTTNICAFIGNTDHPLFPSHKVNICEISSGRVIGYLSFKSEVKAVKLLMNKIIIVLTNKIIIHNISDLKTENEYETYNNDKGLCEVSMYGSKMIIVIPGREVGTIEIINPEDKSLIFQAHKNAIVCFALSSDGSKLATASVQGTLIRVFDTSNGVPLKTLRRGTDYAEICSLTFNEDCKYLACTSQKKTVHIFHLEEKTSSQCYFFNTFRQDYSTSFAKFYIPDKISVVSFGANSIRVITNKGKYYMTCFDPSLSSQICNIDIEENFLLD